MVQWRNTDLDFSSIGALQATLATTPTENALARAPVAEDILVLDHAARDDEVRAMAKTRADVERLWEVCQVPDLPQDRAGQSCRAGGHAVRLPDARGQNPTDWFARQVAQADRTDGDIDTLSTRIAHIRTWTFAANRPDWLADPEHWQGVTRAVEDKLSDALHERLTERFVDRRTSVLMRRLRENATLEPQINKTGEVVVEGHVIGRLDGFVFPAGCLVGRLGRQGAAERRAEGAGRRDRRARSELAGAPDEQFVLAVRRHDPLDRRRGRQSSSPAKTSCARACALLPTSISPARRATRCRRGSSYGSSPTSRSCSVRCSNCPPRAT